MDSPRHLVVVCGTARATGHRGRVFPGCQSLNCPRFLFVATFVSLEGNEALDLQEETMTTTNHYLGTAETPRLSALSNRITRFGLMALRIGLAVGLGSAGLQKLAGSHQMVHMFATIGAGQWLRLFVGTMEVLGSIGLLISRVTGLVASAAAALLVGATITNMAVLHTSPALPLVFLAAAAVMAYTRRADLISLVKLGRQALNLERSRT